MPKPFIQPTFPPGNWHGRLGRHALRRPNVPYASINKRGEIYLNAAAHAALGKLVTVAVLYDPNTNRIALTGRPPFRVEMLNLKPHGRNNRGRIVRAARLLNNHAATIPKTIVFYNLQLHPGPTIILDLGMR